MPYQTVTISNLDHIAPSSLGIMSAVADCCMPWTTSSRLSCRLHTLSLDPVATLCHNLTRTPVSEVLFTAGFALKPLYSLTFKPFLLENLAVPSFIQLLVNHHPGFHHITSLISSFFFLRCRQTSPIHFASFYS